MGTELVSNLCAEIPSRVMEFVSVAGAARAAGACLEQKDHPRVQSL